MLRVMWVSVGQKKAISGRRSKGNLLRRDWTCADAASQRKILFRLETRDEETDFSMSVLSGVVLYVQIIILLVLPKRLAIMISNEMIKYSFTICIYYIFY